LNSGIAAASIVGLDGADVETRVLNGGSNLVGACFFTRLTAFRVEWALSDRTMRIWRA